MQRVRSARIRATIDARAATHSGRTNDVEKRVEVETVWEEEFAGYRLPVEAFDVPNDEDTNSLAPCACPIRLARLSRPNAMSPRPMPMLSGLDGKLTVRKRCVIGYGCRRKGAWAGTREQTMAVEKRNGSAGAKVSLEWGRTGGDVGS